MPINQLSSDLSVKKPVKRMIRTIILKSFFIFLITFIFLSCTADLDEASGDPCQIDFFIESSEFSAAENASGSILLASEGEELVFAVKSAYISDNGNCTYNLKFVFADNNNFNVDFQKFNQDFNYYYPASGSENKLLNAEFDGQPVVLSQSSVVIQPHQGSNTFSVIVSVKTEVVGTFTGTVDGVILL